MQQKTLRRLDGIYHSALTVVIRTWKNSPWRRPVLILAAVLTLFSSSAFLYDNPQKASALVQPNGRLFYGDGTNTALRFQTNSFDFTFGGELSFTHGGSASLIAHTVAKTAPTRDEIMVGALTVDGQLKVVKGINGYDVAGDYSLAWTNTGTTGAQTCNSATEVDCTRAFDIAYERLSGRAMVVYADTTNQKLYYCYWDNSAWGPQSACTPTNGTNDISLTSNGRPDFVSLKAKGGTNELLMGVSIDVGGTHEVETFRWDGDSWEDALLATNTTNASVNTLEAGQVFDVEWESNSGDAIVVWGSTSAGSSVYRLKPSGGAWGSDQTGPALGGGTGVINTMNLEADPVSNRIAFASTDSTNDANFGIWKADGSTTGWTMGNEDATLETDNPGTQYSDMIWQKSGSVAIRVTQTGTTTSTWEYQTATCTGSGCTFSSDTGMTEPTGTIDDGTFIRLAASSNSNDIMLLAGDIDQNLGVNHWNGSAWEGTNIAPLEAALAAGTADGVFQGMSAAFTYVPYQSWQRNWRFFDDETVNDPSTGLNGAAENAVPTAVDPEEIIRLRLNVNDPQPQAQTDARKKLQYTSGASCTPNTVEGDTDCTWVDVGDTSETSAVWRYASRTADGAAVCADASHCDDNQTFTTARLTGTTQNGTYVTDKDAAGGTNMDHNASAIMEIDYPLKAESVSGNTTYYFRAYDVDQDRPVRREQDNDGSNDCASATCTYPSLTTSPDTLSGTVFMADGTTPATAGNGGPCDGSTAVISIKSNAGTADTVFCSNSDATYTKTLSNVSLTAGNEIAVYLTSTMKANTIYLADGSTDSGINLYENRVAVRHENAGPQTIVGMDSYDSDQNDTDMLFDAEDAATDTLIVESGNVLRVESGETFTPGGNVTTPKLHLKGTLIGSSGLSHTYTLNGIGTGTSRPFYIDGGTFTSGTVSVVLFTGTGTSDIQDASYSSLHLQPTSGTETYTLMSGTFNISGQLLVNNGANLTVDVDTNDPTINLAANLVLNNNTTWTASASATFTFNTSAIRTWTDNGSTKQNLGIVAIANGTSGFEVSLGSSVKAMSVNVATSHNLNLNGTNTLTLAGTTGTLFTVGGVFTESSGTVEFTGDGSPTALTGNTAEASTFNDLTLNPSITTDRTYQFGTTSLTVNDSFIVNPTASSTTKTLTVMLGANLNVTAATTTLQGSGTAIGKLDTVSGSNWSITSRNIVIGAGGNLTAQNSSITLNGGSGTLISLDSSGDFFSGGSTINVLPTSAITITSGSFTGADAINNLSISMDLSGGTVTHPLNTADISLNGDLTITPTSSFAGASYLLQLGGNVIVVPTKTTTINAGDTNSPTVTVDLRPSTTDYNLTTGFLNTGDATGGVDTLDAGGSQSVITLTGTSGTLFTASGTFTEGTSDVQVTSASGTPTLLSAAETFHKLTINSAATVVNAGANITTNNTAGNKLYIQSGVFNQENRTITPGTAGTLELGATGTLCLGGTTTATNATCDNGATQTTSQNLPTFTTYTFDPTSTVRYLADAAQTVNSGPVYGNLILGPTLTAGRLYTFGLTPITINGNFTVDPDAASAFALTTNLGGDTTVAAGKTTTITRTGSNATALVDLRPPAAADRNLSTGFLNIATGGTLDATDTTSATIVTLTGTSGTLWTQTGTFTITNATSTVVMNPNASVTLTSNNSLIFYNLTLSPALSGGAKTYTFGTSALTVNNNLNVVPTAGAGSQALTVNMGADITVAATGTTTITPDPTNTPTASVDMRPASTDYKLTSGRLVIGTNGTLDASSTTAAGLINLNAASGTLWTQSGIFTITSATSEVIFTPTASVTLTSNNSMTFYNLSVNGSVSANSTFTLGSQPLTVNNNLIINPQNTDFTSTVLINMGANINVIGNTELGGTGLSPAVTTLDTRPSVTDYNVTSNNFTIDGGILDATGSSSNITVKGNYQNSGTFTAGSSTMTFGDSSGTKTIAGAMTGANALNNVVFNGSGDTWNINAAMRANGNYTMTAGTVVHGANIDITLFGDVLLSSGTIFTKASGTGKLIMDGDSDTETFTDSTSPLQDLGTVQIGLSPGTTNLSSDFSATSLTINTADRLNTRGWEVTVSTFFDAQGTAHYDTTDTGAAGREGDGTITTVGTNWTFSGTGTYTLDTDAGTPTKNVFNGTADQTVTTGGKTFYQFELNNTGAGGSDDVIISGALDVNGAFTITDGDLDTNTNDINTNVAHDFTIGTNGSIDAGTGTWTFDPTGTKTWTDNSSAKWSPGLVTIGSGASTPQINLGSSVEATTVTIAVSHTLALQSSGYTLDIIGTGAAATVLTVTGVLSPGTNSTVKYSATNSGGNVNVTATTYKHLQLSGAETYDLGSNLTSTNAIAGNLTIDSGATLDAVSGSNFNIELAGNYANAGSFTARNGTVTLNGTTTQALSGGMLTTNAFYNLIITNNSGTNPSDNERTDFVASVDFNAAATATNGFTANAAHIRIEFGTGLRYTFTNINWQGTSGAGNMTYFRNSAASGTWELNVSGSQTVSYVNVSRSNASFGTTVDADDGTNFDANNNTNWNFVTLISIEGTVYLADESTVAATICDGVTQIISIRVDGGTATTGICHDTNATYNISIAAPTAGQTVAVYLTSTEKANTIYLSDATADTSINLFENRLALRHENAGPIIITDLDAYDNDQNATDMLFDAEDLATDTLVMDASTELHVTTSKTFKPQGTVTAVDVHIQGTLDMDANNLNISGSYNNAGTFTADTSTTTFTSATSGKTLTGTMTGASGKFHVINFDNASGGWTLENNIEAADNFTVTAGTLNTHDSENNSITATGNFTMQSGGTVDSNASTITVSGNWDQNNSTWNTAATGSGTSTVVLSGASKTLSTNGTSAGDRHFYNLTISGTGNYAKTAGERVNVYNNFIMNTSSALTGIEFSPGGLHIWGGSATVTIDGTMSKAGAGNGSMFIRTSMPTITSSVGIGVRVDFYMNATGTHTIPALNYNGGLLFLGSENNTFRLGAGTFNIGSSDDNWTVSNDTTAKTSTIENTTNNATVNVTNSVNIPSATGSTIINMGSASYNVGASWANSDSSVVDPGTSTITFSNTVADGDIASGGQSFYNVIIDDTGDDITITDAFTATNDLTVTAGDFNGAQNATVNGAVAGTAGTITMSGGTFEQRVSANKNFGTTSGSAVWAFNDLTFSNGNGGGVARTVTTQTGGSGGITVAGILRIGKSGDVASDTTTLDAGNRTWTLSNSNGADPFQILASPAGNLTEATSTFTYTGDNDSGSVTVQSETYCNLSVGGSVTETYVLEGTTATSNAASCGNLTIDTSDTLDAVNNSNHPLSIGNNYTNNGVFTAQNGTVTFNATDAGNTLSGTLNSTSAFYNLTFNGSGGDWTPGSAMLVTNDLTTTAGTLSGSNDITVNGHVGTGNGTVTLTGGTFKQRPATSKNFGPSGGAAWTFNNLTFSFDDPPACPTEYTITTDSGGTGGMGITGVLSLGEVGDCPNTWLNAGKHTWTLSGTGGDPFQIRAGSDLIPSASTFAYTGNNTGGDTTVQSETYGGLTINNGSETYNLEGTTGGAVTITAGTLALNGQTLNTSGTFTINGTLSGSTNVNAIGDVGGSGTVTLTGGTFEQRINANQSFGSTSGTNEWRFATLILSTGTVFDRIITSGAGTGTIRVDTLLQIGRTADTNTATWNNNTANDRILDINGSVDITSKGILQASNSVSFTVGDNWTNSGTFTHNNGTVTFDTTTTATFSGATTFYNFTSTTAAKTLEFTAGQTFTIATGGLLTLTGAADPNEIQIKSTTASQWFINHQGTESVSFVQVINSGCDGASTDITTSSSINDGNNGTCWKFDPVFSQEDFRFGQPNGLNIDYNGAPLENAAYSTSGTSDDFRLRMLIHVADTQLDASGRNFKLQFGEKTAANCTSGVSWGDVATASGVIRYYDAGGRADGDNLVANGDGGDPVHIGHTRVNQDYEEANNFTNTVAAIPAGQDGMWDFSLINDSAVGGKRYCFRAVESDGTLFVNGYNQYPEVIIDEELVFSLDATSKNFGIIQPGDNPTDQTSTVTVTTNAASGYVVYAWSTQAMTKGAHTISDWGGTNGTPTTFANGSFGFGYSTDDSTLTGGTADRFTNGGAKYAGFTHSGPGDPVADRTTGPVSAQANTITYRLAGGVGQQAGTYTTVVVYVAAVTF